jgi:hypothetical protein
MAMQVNGSMPVLDRFWARVDQTDACWSWSGAKNDQGYGQIRVSGRIVYAHRFSYELHVAAIPPGLQLDHLEPVTSGENTRRGEPANRTHCPRGHAYDQANTGHNARTGRRFCKACHSFFAVRTKARRRGIVS